MDTIGICSELSLKFLKMNNKIDKDCSVYE